MRKSARVGPDRGTAGQQSKEQSRIARNHQRPILQAPSRRRIPRLVGESSTLGTWSNKTWSGRHWNNSCPDWRRVIVLPWPPQLPRISVASLRTFSPTPVWTGWYGNSTIANTCRRFYIRTTNADTETAAIDLCHRPRKPAQTQARRWSPAESRRARKSRSLAEKGAGGSGLSWPWWEIAEHICACVRITAQTNLLARAKQVAEPLRQEFAARVLFLEHGRHKVAEVSAQFEVASSHGPVA
jgi:hypothetical protein